MAPGEHNTRRFATHTEVEHEQAQLDRKGCELGQQIRGKLNRVLGGIAVLALVLGLIASLLFVVVRSAKAEIDGRIGSHISEQNKLFHATEPEVRQLQVDCRDNAREWQGLNGRMMAQEALMEANGDLLQEIRAELKSR